MLKEKVKAALDNLNNKAYIFYADDGDGRFQQFFEEDFDSNSIPGWTFTGDWKYLTRRDDYVYSKMHQVYQYTENDESVYIQFSGWWSLYEGAEYRSWEFVMPVEQTVTVWQPA